MDREISTLQMKRDVRKGCKIFAVHMFKNHNEDAERT